MTTKPDKPRIGRPPIYKTEEDRLEARRSQNRAYQKKYHRNVRKKKYANDPVFREGVLQAERLRYQRNNPDYKPKGLGREHGNAAAFAMPMLCKAGAANRTKQVLPLDAMAAFIGISDKIMSEWVEGKKFPRPTTLTTEGQRVYTVPQADALAKVLHSHLKNRATFRATDTAVVVALHAAFLKP
jgi:predicted DNA-binding transcriptional regulator AlpA